MRKKIGAVITALMLCFSAVFGALPIMKEADVFLSANAASADFPMQLMNIAAKDNSKILAENGTSDGSSLSVKSSDGSLSGSWRFDRVNTDSKGTFFKLVNAESGRMLTPNGYSVKSGTKVVMYGAESHQTQHWYVIPVKNDRLGNGLYYKIVNYSDTSLALTQSSSGMILSDFTGADNQLWLLNCDGLQGFAAYCKDDNTGNIKAGDIGGLFGEIVEASTFDELKKYAESDTPYTIVVTQNISVTNLKQDSQNHLYCPDGRIYVRSNKTIIGSYGAHTLCNVQFCTASNKGIGNNIIIKNFDMQHDAKSNGNDSIVVYFGSGQNLWVDHVTFTGHSGYNTLGEATPDWDKFLACCYDADYCTVSDCSFGLHEYGLILGYPDDTEDSYKNKNNFPRMSIISCKFKDTLTRAPGLMRYGYFHSLNNYVYNFSMAYTVHSDCKLFAENCYYDGASTNGNVVCDWNEVSHPGSFADSGSKGVNCRRLTIEGSAKNCTWRPSGNYAYKSIPTDNVKSYCDTYSGAQSKRENMMYVSYSKSGVPSAGFNTAPDGPIVLPSAEMDTSVIYEFKNVNSGLVMDIADGKTEDGTNVRQWEANGFDCQKWLLRPVSGQNEYYFICSAADIDYALCTEGPENGGNISIMKLDANNTAAMFRFTKNNDGSYYITSAASDNTCFVEVGGASKEIGANIQQWSDTGSDCQKWSAATYTTTTTTTTTSTTTTTTSATTTTPATSAPPVTEIIWGDANCDNSVNLADAVLIMQYKANPSKYSISENGLLNSDVADSGDGVSNKDALRIQQFMLGIVTSLTPEK